MLYSPGRFLEDTTLFKKDEGQDSDKKTLWPVFFNGFFKSPKRTVDWDARLYLCAVFFICSYMEI